MTVECRCGHMYTQHGWTNFGHYGQCYANKTCGCMSYGKAVNTHNNVGPSTSDGATVNVQPVKRGGSRSKERKGS